MLSITFQKPSENILFIDYVKFKHSQKMNENKQTKQKSVRAIILFYEKR